MRERAFTFDWVRRLGSDFGRGELFEREAARFDFLEVYEKKTRGIPDFVSEGAGAEDAVVAQDDVRAGSGHAGEHVAKRVGAVLLRQLQRVNTGALSLRHLRAIGGADKRVQVEALEGNAFFGGRTAGEMQAHHDHADIPEKKNVVAAD